MAGKKQGKQKPKGLKKTLGAALGKILHKKPEKKYSKKELSGTWPLQDESVKQAQAVKIQKKKTAKNANQKRKNKNIKSAQEKKLVVIKPGKISQKSVKAMPVKNSGGSVTQSNKVFKTEKKGSGSMSSDLIVSDVQKSVQAVKPNPKKISVAESNNLNELKMPSKKLREVIIESTSGDMPEEKIHSMEARIIGLMQRYNLSESEMEEDIEKLDTDRLLRDFDKLIRLVEMEKKPSHLLYTEEVLGAGVAYGEIPKHPKAFVKEIKRQRVETDVDKVFLFAKKKGKAGSSEISKILGIPKNKVEEYAEILSSANLVDLRYPPIGGVTLILKEKVKSDKK